MIDYIGLVRSFGFPALTSIETMVNQCMPLFFTVEKGSEKLMFYVLLLLYRTIKLKIGICCSPTERRVWLYCPMNKSSSTREN